MKQIVLFIGIVGSLPLFYSCKKSPTDTVKNNCINDSIPPDTYKYPIVPGTPEWATLRTGEARWQACQIPDSILAKMSTEGLVQSWLNLPVINELWVTNSIQQTMEYFMLNFSGLKEVVKRDEAGDKLFKRYKSMKPECITIFNNDIDKGNFILSFSEIGLVLAQDTILNKMTLGKKKILVAEALEKYYKQSDYSNDYGRFPMEHCWFICAKVMMNCRYQPFINELNNNLLWFIKNAQFYIPVDDYTPEIKIIISNSVNFIK